MHIHTWCIDCVYQVYIKFKRKEKCLCNRNIQILFEWTRSEKVLSTIHCVLNGQCYTALHLSFLFYASPQSLEQSSGEAFCVRMTASRCWVQSLSFSSLSVLAPRPSGLASLPVLGKCANECFLVLSLCFSSEVPASCSLDSASSSLTAWECWASPAMVHKARCEGLVLGGVIWGAEAWSSGS